jgi:hypothetical protein
MDCSNSCLPSISLAKSALNFTSSLVEEDDYSPLDINILEPEYQVQIATYNEIETGLGRGYTDPSNVHLSSNVLDVLSIYIKGQKLLYTEAKTYCEQQLNFLMLPAIFISCVGSIFSFVSEKYDYGPIIIASLNGFNAFILALISYLKLDAKAQAHKTSAYKFDKLESICEFNSGKFLFFQSNTETISEIVERIETGVKEIKETNQFILPETIRYNFHFTYSTNVFTLVKRMQLQESKLINTLKKCINKQQLLKIMSTSQTDRENVLKAIQDEEELRGRLIDEIFKLRKKYYDLDSQLNNEINKHMKQTNQWFITRVICCDWLKS